MDFHGGVGPVGPAGLDGVSETVEGLPFYKGSPFFISVVIRILIPIYFFVAFQAAYCFSTSALTVSRPAAFKSAMYLGSSTAGST